MYESYMKEYHMLHNSPLSLEELGTRARRALKKDDLQALYTTEELYELLGHTPDPSDTWIGLSTLLKGRARSANPKERRRWSHVEDKFLYDTYMYLPDTSIALALNIPSYEVHRHRVGLKLRKIPEAKKGVFVVWHNRENFEQDMELYGLTKSRGSDMHHLL